jgi:hypothetical protein
LFYYQKIYYANIMSGRDFYFFFSYTWTWTDTLRLCTVQDLGLFFKKYFQDLVWTMNRTWVFYIKERVWKNISMLIKASRSSIRQSASFLVKFDLRPHQTFVFSSFHFPYVYSLKNFCFPLKLRWVTNLPLYQIDRVDVVT